MIHGGPVDVERVGDIEPALAGQGDVVFAGILAGVGMVFGKRTRHGSVKHLNRRHAVLTPRLRPVPGALAGFVGGEEVGGGNQRRCADPYHVFGSAAGSMSVALISPRAALSAALRADPETYPGDSPPACT